MIKATYLLLTMLILVSCSSSNSNDVVDEYRKLLQEYLDYEGTSQKAKREKARLKKIYQDYLLSLKGKQMSTSCYLDSISFPSEVSSFKDREDFGLMLPYMYGSPGKKERDEKIKVLSRDQKIQNLRTYTITCHEFRSNQKKEKGATYRIHINDGFLSNNEKEMFDIIEEKERLFFSGTINYAIKNLLNNDLTISLDNDDLWDVVESEVIKLNRLVFFDFE
tara:strand:- start:576 stop:1238 length:663 start_codon:yes stop_codon:yes gene_type:complete